MVRLLSSFRGTTTSMATSSDSMLWARPPTASCGLVRRPRGSHVAPVGCRDARLAKAGGTPKLARWPQPALAPLSGSAGWRLTADLDTDAI